MVREVLTAVLVWVHDLNVFCRQLLLQVSFDSQRNRITNEQVLELGLIPRFGDIDADAI